MKLSSACAALGRHGDKLVYLGIALIIMGPLLGPGYILTLDMNWVPHPPPPSGFESGWVYGWLRTALCNVVPSMLVQKVLLTSLFIGAGLGAHRLARLCFQQPHWTYYVAGLMYLVNPFSYDRFVTGQYLVLAGWALLPWFIRSYWQLMEQPTWRAALVAAAWLTAIGWTSIHSLGIAAVSAGVSVVAYGLTRGTWRRRIGWTLGVVGAWLGANGWWLVPVAFGRGAQGQLIQSFSPSQFQAFATVPDPHVGVLGNALGLYGMWTDAQGRYLVPKAGGWWLVPLVVILGLVGLGWWRERRQLASWILVATGALALVLGLGLAWSPGRGITQALIDHVPLYRGYREPAKWFMLSALVYAVLASAGVAAVAQHLKTRAWLATSALALPFLYMPVMLWGAAGQLKSVDYPASWYAVEDTLARTPGPGSVLALPWHEYLELNFVGRTVASPVVQFFHARPVVISNNPELRGVGIGVRSPAQTRYEDEITPQRLTRVDAGSQLAGVGVEYVLLLKTADWQHYGWLDRQTDLKQVIDSPTLRLYLNQAYRR